MVSILTRKIRKLKVDHHFKNVDVNDFHLGIHSWVSWLASYHFNKTSFQANLMGYVINYQNDKIKKCNQFSINLCGLLFLLIFSLGLVMCLLPSTNNGNEEIAVVKTISNSPGKFCISNICHVVPIDHYIKIDIIKDMIRLPNILIWTVLLPLVLNIVKQTKKIQV